MIALCKAVFDRRELDSIIRRIKEGNSPVMICGLSPVHRALAVAAVQAELLCPVAVISQDDVPAAAFAENAAAVSGIEYGVLPSRELVFHNVESFSHEYENKRCDIFSRLSDGTLTAVCGSVEAFLLRTIPPGIFGRAAIKIQLGQPVNTEELLHRLSELGYSRMELVEGVGQFARKGGIIDIFPPSSPKAVRIEFFGDEPDSMGLFDTVTQRRTENIEKIVIPPARETPPDLAEGGRPRLAARIRGLLKGLNRSKLQKKYLDIIASDSELIESGARFAALDRYLPIMFSELACALDYLPADTVIFLDDGPRVREQVKSLSRRIAEDIKQNMESGLIGGRQVELYLGEQDFYRYLTTKSAITLDSFAGQSELPLKEIISLASKQLPYYAGSFEALLADIKHYKSIGRSTIVLASNSGRVKHLSALLEENGILPVIDHSLSALPPPGGIMLSIGSLSSGIELPRASVAVLCDITQQRERKKRVKKPEKSGIEKLKSFTDLKEGDIVVHDVHGIGRYCGICTMAVDGIDKDFIKLAYAGGDVLYIPVTQLDVISKYFGAAEDSAVKLSKLGGTDWAKAKSRAKAAAKDYAKQLIALYSKRLHTPGFTFSPDSPWQKEFEDGFEYEETEDQLVATTEIKKDMESNVPMDRLLCGDVGFGKTEVAFRAALKCMLDGKQVAFLVPTTVLARQHYMTALHRFRGIPVKIAALSRFLSASETKETLRKLKNGTIDMVIGTHKLLGKGVKFHDLGLLIVDEEQRFGVTHKERLKEIACNTDVLTLTATPIPRTLNMVLSGVRDMSVLEESPQDRYPVATYVIEYDETIIRDAIMRELSRGGQVYYLHNRIETISKKAAALQRMFPDARIAVGHGRLDEAELAEVMSAVADGEVDILVCTTIIEAGIDIPNVNTLIIEDADKLGLAQLYQIRGRVGRSSRHAYAYLTFRKNAVLSEVSQKRLAAMRDFAEFGAGFKIAMRDLEIRGAGNLLGTEQSGHMVSVGYDMYMRLLEEAVLEEKGQKPVEKPECKIELSVPASIPETYISSSYERMDLYRKIARIADFEDLDDIRDELVDKFGDYPEETDMLLKISLLRRRAADAGISEIADSGREISFFFKSPKFEVISRLFEIKELKGKIFLKAGAPPRISVRIKHGDDRYSIAELVVNSLYESGAEKREK
jgi:transcription-repair coupling factor (superfamily II helicase)